MCVRQPTQVRYPVSKVSASSCDGPFAKLDQLCASQSVKARSVNLVDGGNMGMDPAFQPSTPLYDMGTAMYPGQW